MMKNTIKKFIAALTAAAVLTGISGVVIYAEPEETVPEQQMQTFSAAEDIPETYINLDFDRTGFIGSFQGDKYDRSERTIETDPETGNKFIRFTYDKTNTQAPLYCEDMHPTSGADSRLNITGNIVMNFDIRRY